MSDPKTSADAEKLQQASSAYQSLGEKLEHAYTRWDEVNDQIEKLEAELR